MVRPVQEVFRERHPHIRVFPVHQAVAAADLLREQYNIFVVRIGQDDSHPAIGLEIVRRGKTDPGAPRRSETERRTRMAGRIHRGGDVGDIERPVQKCCARVLHPQPFPGILRVAFENRQIVSLEIHAVFRDGQSQTREGVVPDGAVQQVDAAVFFGCGAVECGFVFPP